MRTLGESRWEHCKLATFYFLGCVRRYAVLFNNPKMCSEFAHVIYAETQRKTPSCVRGCQMHSLSEMSQVFLSSAVVQLGPVVPTMRMKNTTVSCYHHRDRH